ncbi:MAG: dihydropteroate synthase [Planctomycetota bacterium]|nr:dihydropteroate synthase [Planctomycetota bacterium]MDA1113305.1 dihydropteroate synthase [Planctomycetota bacterium]
MLEPWELPGAAMPHHAFPLGEGCWRAPAAKSASCKSALREFGVESLGSLADGSASYAIHGLKDLLPPLPEGDVLDPAYRALWIASRLGAARTAMARPTKAPKFMAILNLTPDSFSDGGTFSGGTMGPLYHAQCLLAEQADILDLGAESTRPGAQRVSANEQLQRIMPVLESLLPLQTPLSIDTRSADVAARCLHAGASMINDVSGLSDPDMAPLLAENGCETVLMHMRGTPATMQKQTQYLHLRGEVFDELMAMVQNALAAGMAPEQIILDPGIGFAKDAFQSQELIAKFGCFRALGFPLLAGPSRKSFMTHLLPGAPPHQRDGGTAGAAALCAAQGAEYVRMHRGGKSVDAMKVAAACAKPKPAEVPCPST